MGEVQLKGDGRSGVIRQLTFVDAEVHRYLSSVEAELRVSAAQNALRVGSEALNLSASSNDLRTLSAAVRRLDEESTNIVAAATKQMESAVTASTEHILASLEASDSPLKSLLAEFDPRAEGNVVDTFRRLVSSATRSATAEAVAELAERSQATMEKLTLAINNLERLTAVEEARQIEVARGTAKGLDHEATTEFLLGEFVAVAGDGLDDVSTVLGLMGNKKGDKVITPKGGVPICTEEKSTARMSESKARETLREAMDNRGTELGMLIVDDQSKVPGNQLFHLIDDDMVVVVAERTALRLVYQYFRAKSLVMMKSQVVARPDDIGEFILELEWITQDMRRLLERFKLLRTEHTKARRAAEKADEYLESLAVDLSHNLDRMSAVIEDLSPDSARKAS